MAVDRSSALKGKLLIAMPQLPDPNFHKTVTCMAEAMQEGALGLVINRIIPSLTGESIFRELEIDCTRQVASMPIHYGGPVRKSELFVLHGPPLDWQGSFRITPALAMTGSRELLESIAGDRGPADFLFCLGCAGWGPMQLEREILENAWLTCDMSEDLIFRTPVEERWDTAVKELGIDPANLSGMAGHA